MHHQPPTCTRSIPGLLLHEVRKLKPVYYQSINQSARPTWGIQNTITNQVEMYKQTRTQNTHIVW